MARKRKAGASSSAPPPSPPPQREGNPPTYIDDRARKESVAIKAKAFVRERGIAEVLPQSEIIQARGWQKFAKPDQSAAVKSVVQELYANLCSARSDMVTVRGCEVNITPKAINEYYGLPNIAGDGLSQIVAQHPP